MHGTRSVGDAATVGGLVRTASFAQANVSTFAGTIPRGAKRNHRRCPRTFSVFSAGRSSANVTGDVAAPLAPRPRARDGLQWPAPSPRSHTQPRHRVLAARPRGQRARRPPARGCRVRREATRTRQDAVRPDAHADLQVPLATRARRGFDDSVLRGGRDAPRAAPCCTRTACLRCAGRVGFSPLLLSCARTPTALTHQPVLPRRSPLHANKQHFVSLSPTTS